MLTDGEPPDAVAVIEATTRIVLGSSEEVWKILELTPACTPLVEVIPGNTCQTKGVLIKPVVIESSEQRAIVV